jgi:chemotaxis signal transduction protein
LKSRIKLFFKIYFQDVNTHTSVQYKNCSWSTNLPAEPSLCEGVTVLRGQVMGGTAVKKWAQKKKNTAAEGYEIRRECG